MIYISEKEKLHKESYLKLYGQNLVQSYRERESLSDHYWLILDRILQENMAVLDLGAGKKGMLSLFKKRNIKVTGLDISARALQLNNHIDRRVCADAHHLPFKENSFDVIVSQWLLEHSAYPRLLVQESSRILKEHGILVLVSNSLLCPLMLFSAMFPGRLRDKLKKSLLPKEVEEDTFPTYYRANTRKSLQEITGDFEFREQQFLFANDLSFFIFDRILFSLSLLWDRLTAIKPLNPLRMHFVAVYEKVTSPP